MHHTVGSGCTNPRTGAVKPPKYFTRVLAGGVLAELRLRGAVVIEGSLITEVRPMTTGDVVADEVLAKIVRHVQLGWPGARQTRLVGLPIDYEDTAGQAHQRLTSAGAAGFAGRAARELAAVGERPPNAATTPLGRLTVQEARVAALVAAGATNREAAEKLFLSPRTVDAHMRNILRKLEITSRRSLRDVLGARDLSGAGGEVV